MNLLEQYIVEVHSVEPYTEDWTKSYDKDFVKVDITTDCYGAKKRGIKICDTTEWEQIQKQGYYWG